MFSVGDNLLGIHSARFNNNELNNHMIKIDMFPFSIIYNNDFNEKYIFLKIGILKYYIGITIDY